MLTIRPVDLACDVEQITAIYNFYIRQTTVTFEEQPLLPDLMRERICQIQTTHPYLIATDEQGAILGYAYAAYFGKRSAYRYTAELSVYTDPQAKGKGVGSLLYSQLIDRLKQTDIRVVIGVIALPNEKSIALHQQLGFQKAGRLHRVGYKMGQWLDVEHWELDLKYSK